MGTERVQLELASSRKELNRALESKEDAMAKARSIEDDRAALARELAETRKKLSTTGRELEASERRAQAIHREKLETVSVLRQEIVAERAEVEKALHEKELTSVDLRRAAEDR